jgi:hypothetical protein
MRLQAPCGPLPNRANLLSLLVTNPLMEATTGFEPVMRVLQTLALPLGDVAGLCRE